MIFTRHGTLEAGRTFYADVKGRLAAYGRGPDDLKIMPGVRAVVADTDEEAQEHAAGIRRLQVSPQNAILALEQVWGRDLSSYDPDGPFPAIDPEPDSEFAQGRVRIADPFAVAARWRALSEEKGLSIRETVIETTTRQSFVGSPETVAAEMTDFVDQRAADGFILVPHLTPGGLDDFVDRVVPSSRNVVRSGPSTPVPPCGHTSGWPNPYGKVEHMSTNATQEWQSWHEGRTAALRRPTDCWRWPVRTGSPITRKGEFRPSRESGARTVTIWCSAPGPRTA